MADSKAVPETEGEKKQGDELDAVLGKSTGLAQDPARDDEKRTPANEPLK